LLVFPSVFIFDKLSCVFCQTFRMDRSAHVLGSVLAAVSGVSVAEHAEKSVVVVTGASKGIGRAICFALAENGFRHIAVTARSLDEAREVASQLPHGIAKAFSLDVTSDKSVADCFANIAQVVLKLFFCAM
jgi:shikimate 5-dehydrogenase